MRRADGSRGIDHPRGLARVEPDTPNGLAVYAARRSGRRRQLKSQPLLRFAYISRFFLKNVTKKTQVGLKRHAIVTLGPLAGAAT